MQVFADVLTTAVRDGVSAGIAAVRIEQQAPMFGPVGRWLQANQGLLALLAFVATVVVGIVQIEQEVDKEPAAKEPPAKIEVDRDAVKRTVEEGLREQGVRLTPPSVQPSTTPGMQESTTPHVQPFMTTPPATELSQEPDGS